MKRRQMSKKAETLVSAFDSAAQWYGWAKDQGTAHQAAQAEVERQETFDKLRRYITRLETLREESLKPKQSEFKS